MHSTDLELTGIPYELSALDVLKGHVYPVAFLPNAIATVAFFLTRLAVAFSAARAFLLGTRRKFFGGGGQI